jgi:hypothetical protein
VSAVVAHGDEAVDVLELNHEEGRDLLDTLARRYLDMSAEEFIAAWDAGDFNGRSGSPEVARVAMLLPFGR